MLNFALVWSVLILMSPLSAAESDMAYNPDYVRAFSKIFQLDNAPKPLGTRHMVKIYESQTKVPFDSLSIRVIHPKDKVAILPFYPTIKLWVLDHSYWIDSHLVTNGMFLNFIKKTKRKMKLKFKPEDENMPVVGISWDDAQAYAAWTYKRLPSRYELSRAFRLGKIKPTPYQEWAEDQQLYIPLKNSSPLTSFRCAM